MVHAGVIWSLIIAIITMEELEQRWNLLHQTGETHFLRKTTWDLQEQLLCLHAYRHLLSREVFLKGLNQCFSLLPGAFSSETLQLQYLISTKASKEALEDLPQWKAIFEEWFAIKHSPDVADDKFLMKIISLNGLRSPQMLVVFMDCIAEPLAQMIVRRHVKLADMERLNFKDTSSSIKVAFTISNLITFLNLLLPHVLFNAVMSPPYLPLALADRQQFECMYSNREMQFIVKQCPQFSALLRVIFGVVTARLAEVGPVEQRIVMLAAFRFYYLYQQVKDSRAVEVLVNCFNEISESVRFALTEEFLLFLHVARKLGREKLVYLLLDKSAWLRDIDSKTTSRKVVGYSLELLEPINCSLPEHILIQRGCNVNRYIQCIDDHCLVFLRVHVDNLDINIRISLQGEHLSKAPVQFIPLMFEKEKGKVIKTLIFPRRGVYCIQFDNSYSWLNAKSITYQRIILTPLSYSSSKSFPFQTEYYLGIPLNSVAKDQLVNVDFKPTSNVLIQKREGLFTFSIQKRGREIYHYETDSSTRFVSKLQQLAATGRSYHYFFQSQKIDSVQGVEQMLKRSSVRRRDKEELIEMIALKY